MPHTCTGYDGKPDVTWVQDGWKDVMLGDGCLSRSPNMVSHTTQWLKEVACGHTKRATDPDCAHCPRSKE